MVFELRPDIDWDKGRAVRWLLEAMRHPPADALFLGDDLTDETVFQTLSGEGTGIIVADVARSTAADLRLDSVDQVQLGLRGIAGTVASLTFNTARIAASADTPTAAATDLAESLVRSGTPFRDAHAIVGALVRQTVDEGADLKQLIRDHEALGPDAAGLIDPGVPVKMRTTRGGAGPAAVADQMQRFEEQLAVDRARLPT